MPKPPRFQSETRRQVAVTVTMIALLGITLGMGQLYIHSRLATLVPHDFAGLQLSLPEHWRILEHKPNQQWRILDPQHSPQQQITLIRFTVAEPETHAGLLTTLWDSPLLNPLERRLLERDRVQQLPTPEGIAAYHHPGSVAAVSRATGITTLVHHHMLVITHDQRTWWIAHLRYQTQLRPDQVQGPLHSAHVAHQHKILSLLRRMVRTARITATDHAPTTPQAPIPAAPDDSDKASPETGR